MRVFLQRRAQVMVFAILALSALPGFAGEVAVLKTDSPSGMSGAKSSGMLPGSTSTPRDRATLMFQPVTLSTTSRHQIYLLRPRQYQRLQASQPTQEKPRRPSGSPSRLQSI